jgi:hypothetical protein
VAIQSLKQRVSRRLIGEAEHFWQKRYYDSTSGTTASSPRSSATFTATRSAKDCAFVPRIGDGAAFVTTPRETRDVSKLNPNGLQTNGSAPPEGSAS